MAPCAAAPPPASTATSVCSVQASSRHPWLSWAATWDDMANASNVAADRMFFFKIDLQCFENKGRDRRIALRRPQAYRPTCRPARAEWHGSGHWRCLSAGNGFGRDRDTARRPGWDDFGLAVAGERVPRRGYWAPEHPPPGRGGPGAPIDRRRLERSGCLRPGADGGRGSVLSGAAGLLLFFGRFAHVEHAHVEVEGLAGQRVVAVDPDRVGGN